MFNTFRKRPETFTTLSAGEMGLGVEYTFVFREIRILYGDFLGGEA